jgi:hydroxyacylglutathione hydrolase
MAAIIPIPAFTDNYVWLLAEGRAAVVVDPGDAAPVEDALGRERLELAAVLATHHHEDHVGGIEALVRRRRVPVFGPARETIPARTHAVRHDDRVALDALNLELRVVDVPGHTAGHVAYVGDFAGAPVLFCGDTLFAAGCGRIFEGTPEVMWASLGKLAALDPATRVYCAHEYTLANLRFASAVEPSNAALAQRVARDAARRGRGEPTLPSTIADELATNPFLRAGVPEVRAAAAAHAGRPLDRDVDAFAALRAWKNAFR